MNRKLYILSVMFIMLAGIKAIAQPKQWQSFGIGGGGAMFSPALSPGNDSDMYIACDMTDLFHSHNNGANWTAVDFRQVLSSQQTKVCYTNNPKILYTLDYSNNGCNLTKSTDGGVNWSHLSGWKWYAYSIFTDVQDSLRVLAADKNNIYFTKDGGRNFTKIFSYPGTAWNTGCHVAGAFFDGNNIYVATPAGILLSIDGGKTFAISAISGIPVAEHIISFSGAKQNGFTRFYCITLDSNYVYPGVFNLDYTVFRGVYKLDMGKKSWVSMKGNINTTYQNFTYCGMAVNDTSTVYLGGSWTNPPYTNGNPLIFKSLNSGPWQNIMTSGQYQTDGQNQNSYTAWTGFKGDNPWYSSMPIGFAVAPLNSKRVIITGMGDAYLTYDGGKLWHQLYQDTADNNPPFKATPKGKNYHSNGLEVTGCWWLTWLDSMNIFAGYTDIKGTRSTDGGKSWSFNYTGHDLNTMYHMVTSPLNGYIYAATSGIHDMYKSTKLMDAEINPGGANEAGKVIYSADKGATWSLLYDFKHPVIKLATDPNNKKRLYAAVIHHATSNSVGGIYVCNDIVDSGSIWHMLPLPGRTEGHPFDLHVLKDGSLLCTYSGRRINSGFTASSGAFLLPKGATTWVDRSDPNMQYYTKDIVIDAYDTTESTWYACVNNGWGGAANDRGGLYLTTDRGKSWKRLTTSVEPAVFAMSFESGTISPYNKNEMYLTTTNYGLWYTKNLRDATPVFTQLPEYPFSAPQRVFYHPFHKNEIWVTSFGNGLRKGITTNISSSIETVPQSIQVANFKVFPNPANGLTHINLDLLRASYISLTIYDALGNQKSVLAKGIYNGQQQFTWSTLGLPEGIYFCELLSGAYRQVVKVIVTK